MACPFEIMKIFSRKKKRFPKVYPAHCHVFLPVGNEQKRAINVAMYQFHSRCNILSTRFYKESEWFITILKPEKKKRYLKALCFRWRNKDARWARGRRLISECLEMLFTPFTNSRQTVGDEFCLCFFFFPNSQLQDDKIPISFAKTSNTITF